MNAVLAPGGSLSHKYIDRAVAAGWDLDGAKNGIWLPTKHGTGTGLPGHGYHPAYTQYVGRELDILEKLADDAVKNGTPMSNAQILAELDALIANVRSKVIAVGDAARLNADAKTW